ncbi:hypothetical protein [Ruminococcus sp.]|uniref:hypothetical protein n=1 Tax=Ruminococcus sp. TaxID=41978 RepID=UPI001B0D09AA|nr:hypothetical protein [Ruminococcus sp.]MBO5558298.1 hypothetical protein [Ruminococcus sp.]
MAQTYLKKIELASRAECRNRKKIRLILLILTIVGALFEIKDYKVMTITENAYNDGIRFQRSPSLEGIFGAFLMFLAACFGLFAVHGVFSDLTSKQNADIQLSLPMNAKERYLSKLMAVFKLHILPILTAGIAVILIGSAKEDAFDMMGYILRFQLVTLALALFVDSVSIFCMSCCGAKAEGIYTSIIMGGCISVLPIMFFMEAIIGFSGVDNTYSFYMNPFYVFGGSILTALEEVGTGIGATMPYILANLLMSFATIFAAYFIYRRRDGRHVGKPIVYSLFLELFMFTGLTTLFFIFVYTGGWSIGITAALIICIVIRIILARAKITPIKFVIWIGKYAAALAAFIVIMGAAYYTGGFGYYKVRYHMNNEKAINIEATAIFANQSSAYTYSEAKNRYFQRDFRTENTTAANDVTVPANCTREEAKQAVEDINDLIDRYHNLQDRDNESFLSIFTDNYSNRYYSHNYDYYNIRIMISDLKFNTKYTANITLDDETEYEEFCSELSKILEESYTESYR